MIIHDLNVSRIPVVPDKANPELIVDPDAVLSLSVPVQRFEAIPRQRGEIAQFPRLVDLNQLAAQNFLDGLKLPDELIHEEFFGMGIAKGSDQNLSYNDNN